MELGDKAFTGLNSKNKRSHRLSGGLMRRVGAREVALATLAQSKLRLDVSIAKKYQTSEVPQVILIKNGNIGLICAVEKFELRRGFKFSFHAAW